MIKVRKGHVSLKGNGEELFLDMRCIMAAMRQALEGELGAVETEHFISNAVLSSMSAEWREKIRDRGDECAVCAEKEECDGFVQLLCVRRGYGRHKSVEGVSVGTIYAFKDGRIVLDDATVSPTVESIEELCRVLGHKFVPVDNIKEVKPVS